LSEAGQHSPWFMPHADQERLIRAGLKPHGGGTHQSKTMMLADLTALMEDGGFLDPAAAIIERNVLGKPSMRAREVSLKRLRELYGLDIAPPICSALHELWSRDPGGRPLLALLCALARDPSLRDGADAVLDAPPGARVRAPAITEAFEERHPGRLGEKMAQSLARNAASTWTQAGYLEGPIRKVRTRAKPSPAVAAYAALIATVCGFGGPALLECRWLDVLDRPLDDRLSLLRQAEGLGLARVRAAGSVLEVEVRQPLASALEIPDLVNV